MVRAILDGRKTQTRRVVKPQPGDFYTHGYPSGFDKDGDWVWWNGPIPMATAKNRFGVSGDRLWVKETFLNNALDGYNPVWFYRADDADKPEDRHWRPSIFMPRQASRITLEIVSVRVERLHEIGKDGRKASDVLAEGITKEEIAHWEKWLHPDDAPAHTYGVLWDSINSKTHPWKSNPWVWVITFKRVK